EVRHQVHLLVDDADAVLLRSRRDRYRDLRSIDPDGALVALVYPGEDLHQRRLPGTVLADKHQHLAGVEPELNVLQCVDTWEALADPLHLKERLCHCPPASSEETNRHREQRYIGSLGSLGSDRRELSPNVSRDRLHANALPEVTRLRSTIVQVGPWQSGLALPAAQRSKTLLSSRVESWQNPSALTDTTSIIRCIAIAAPSEPTNLPIEAATEMLTSPGSPIRTTSPPTPGQPPLGAAGAVAGRP